MQITLYKFVGEENVLDKSGYLTQVAVLNGTLRDGSNLLTPSITIEDDNNLILNQQPNYCYIPDFNRYYFITNVGVYRNIIRVLSLKVDVLYSFNKVPLTITNLYMSRRTNGSTELYDDAMPFKYKKEVTSPSNFLTGVIYPNGQFDTQNRIIFSYCVVISVINDQLPDIYGVDNPVINYDEMSGYGSLPKITKYSSGEDYCAMYYVINLYQLRYLVDKIVEDDTILSWIKTVTVLPFDISKKPITVGGVKLTNMYVGNGVSISFPSYQPPIPEPSPGQEPVIPDPIPQYVYYARYGNHYRHQYCYFNVPSSSNYYDYQPLTKVELYIPYAGYKELNLESVRGCKLVLFYIFNFDMSISSFILYNQTKEIIEIEDKCNIGCKLGMNTSNQREIENQQLQNGIATGVEAFAGLSMVIAGTILDMVPGGQAFGVGMQLSGATMFDGAIVKGAVKASTLLTYGKSEVGSGHDGLFSMQEISVKVTKYVRALTTQSYNNYVANIGLPYCQYSSIDDLSSGEFFVVGDVSDLKIMIGMTKPEYDELKEKLQAGCYKS